MKTHTGTYLDTPLFDIRTFKRQQILHTLIHCRCEVFLWTYYRVKHKISGHKLNYPDQPWDCNNIEKYIFKSKYCLKCILNIFSLR